MMPLYLGRNIGLLELRSTGAHNHLISYGPSLAVLFAECYVTFFILFTHYRLPFFLSLHTYLQNLNIYIDICFKIVLRFKTCLEMTYKGVNNLAGLIYLIVYTNVSLIAFINLIHKATFKFKLSSRIHRQIHSQRNLVKVYANAM